MEFKSSMGVTKFTGKKGTELFFTEIRTIK
jgi:hypothetical protein